MTRKGRPAQQHRHADPLRVEFLQVLFHHGHGLDEQPGEADRVGLLLAPSLDDVSDGLLDVIMIQNVDLNALLAVAASAIGVGEPLDVDVAELLRR